MESVVLTPTACHVESRAHGPGDRPIHEENSIVSTDLQTTASGHSRPQPLAERVAIVAGAGKGFGAAIATAFAAAGAAVVVNYARDAQAATAVAASITSAGGRAVTVQADVSDADAVRALFATAREHFGPVDLLVNNAGVYAFAPLHLATEDQFHRQFGINVLAPMLTTQAFAAQSEVDGGAVINISTAGVATSPVATGLYSASKAALETLTRVSAKELADRGIRVNAIAPTASDTEGTRAMGFINSPAADAAAAGVPLGRLGRPADIAPVAVFLASRDAGFITAEVIHASGGDL